MAATGGRTSTTTTTRPSHHPRAARATTPHRPPSVVLMRARPAVAARATRRDIWTGGLLGGASLALLPLVVDRRRALAAADPAIADAPSSTPATPTTYSDAADGFSLSIPSGWTSGEGSLSGNASFSGATGARRAVAFFDPSSPGTNVVVVVGNTSAEFTKMSSFGTANNFGTALVNSMDRGFLLRAPSWVRNREAGPGGAVQVARLIDAKEVDVPGADGGGVGYLTDYTIAQVFPDGGGAPADGVSPPPKRHLLSVAALHATPQGYRRIVTVTAQTTAEDGDAGEGARLATLRGIVGSFRIA